MAQELRNFTLEEWLNTYSEVKTKGLYASGVKSFLRLTYGSDQDLATLASRYITEVQERKRDYFRDILAYIGANHARPPNGLKTYLATVKSFLLYCCGVDIPTRQQRLLNAKLPKGNKARSREHELSREDLQKILLHCDVKGRGLFLFLVSSGVRIGEALQLRLSDIELDNNPPVVHVRGEYAKEGDSYITFLSKESKQALEEWLKTKDAFMQRAVNKSAGIRSREWRPWTKQGQPADSSRLFPFSSALATKMLLSAVQKAGLHAVDPSTGRRTIHLHVFRKYFLSQVKLGIPSEVAEAMVGHSTYLSDSYRRYTTRQLGELYLKGEPYVTIEGPVGFTELQKEVEEKNGQLQTLLTGVVTENIELKTHLKETQERLSGLEDRLEKAEFFISLREKLDKKSQLVEMGELD